MPIDPSTPFAGAITTRHSAMYNRQIRLGCYEENFQTPNNDTLQGLILRMTSSSHIWCTQTYSRRPPEQKLLIAAAP